MRSASFLASFLRVLQLDLQHIVTETEQFGVVDTHSGTRLLEYRLSYVQFRSIFCVTFLSISSWKKKTFSFPFHMLGTVWLCQITEIIPPITLAPRSKIWTLFARSNAGIVGSNPTQGMDVCVRLFSICVVLCVGSDLATGWSSVQGVLPTEYRIKKLKNGQGLTKDCRARQIGR
jgi:hypothetical protein